MPVHRAAWEREIYYDSPGGSTATTQLDHIVDVNLGKEPEFVEDTDRGTAGTIPKKTELPVTRTANMSFVMNYFDSDTQMADLLAAEQNTLPLAFKIVEYSGGPTVFDGDCYLSWDSPGGLKDGRPVTFTLRPTRNLGRTWSDS